MDEGIIFLIAVALFVLTKTLGSRKNRAEIPEDDEELPDETETAPEETKKASDDFEALRDILRKSWGLDRETGKDANAPGGIYREAPRVKTPEPAPAIRKAPEKKKPAEKDTIFTEKEKQKTAAIRWTDEDAKRWVILDTVLGRPRSRAPWRPFEGRM